MLNITKFDRDELTIMRGVINSKLAELEDKFNIKISLANMSYDETSFTAKVKCNLVIDGEVVNPYASDFKKYKNAWGLKFSLGYEFKLNGSSYKVVGLKTRNRKYPILVEDLKTKNRYKFTTKTINNIVDLYPSDNCEVTK